MHEYLEHNHNDAKECQNLKYYFFYGIVICKFMACGRKMIHNSMFDKMKQERRKKNEFSIVLIQSHKLYFSTIKN